MTPTLAQGDIELTRTWTNEAAETEPQIGLGALHGSFRMQKTEREEKEAAGRGEERRQAARQLQGCCESLACRGLGATWLGPGLEGAREKALLLLHSSGRGGSGKLEAGGHEAQHGECVLPILPEEAGIGEDPLPSPGPCHLDSLLPLPQGTRGLWA